MTYKKWEFTKGKHPKEDFIEPGVFNILSSLWLGKYKHRNRREDKAMHKWFYRLNLRPGWIVRGYLGKV